MKVSYDPEARAGYIYLVDDKAEESIPVPDTQLVLDFNQAGELVGIEFLDPSEVPREILEKGVSGGETPSSPVSDSHSAGDEDAVSASPREAEGGAKTVEPVAWITDRGRIVEHRERFSNIAEASDWTPLYGPDTIRAEGEKVLEDLIGFCDSKDRVHKTEDFDLYHQGFEYEGADYRTHIQYPCKHCEERRDRTVIFHAQYVEKLLRTFTGGCSG